MSEKDQSVVLTDKGYDDCDRILGKSMFDPRDPWAPFVINSVKAKEIFTRDKVGQGLSRVSFRSFFFFRRRGGLHRGRGACVRACMRARGGVGPRALCLAQHSV